MQEMQKRDVLFVRLKECEFGVWSLEFEVNDSMSLYIFVDLSSAGGGSGCCIKTDRLLKTSLTKLKGRSTMQFATKC